MALRQILTAQEWLLANQTQRHTHRVYILPRWQHELILDRILAKME